MPARTPAWLLRTRIDWIGALGVSGFQGREVELAELSQWILQEHCRLITILSMGGIGKSALVSLLGQQLAPQFEIVLWRSVRDAPSCEELVADAITFCSETPPSELPVSLERRIDQLVARLQKRRCLLVLDNLETLLEERDSASTCRWVGHAHTSLVSAVCWSPDGTRLATCSDDHTVRLWQAEDGILLQTLQGHSKDVASIVWSPDGRFLASCGHDGVTHMWEMQSAAHLCTLRGDRPYERLAIVETTGLNEAQKTTLRALGAIEEREGLLKA